MDFYKVIEKRRTVRDFEPEEIPDDYFMPCFIGIGRTKKEAAPVRQNRVDLKERIHWNCF